MAENKNYMFRMWALLLCAAVVLSLLYYLPEHIGPWELKPVDMLSQIRKVEADSLGIASPEELLNKPIQIAEKPKRVPSKTQSAKSETKPAPTQAQLSPEEQERRDALYQQSLQESGVVGDSTFTPIEDYSAGHTALSQYYRALASRKHLGRPVRIAVLGDSFIEGDIFTAPLRRQLQDKYGGGGIGWLPLSSQTAGFRSSIRHEFEGWTDHSVLTSSKAKQVLSGHYFSPRSGAWVRYTLPKGSPAFTEVAMYYTATGESSINLQIQDSTLRHSLPPSSAMQVFTQEWQGGATACKLSVPASTGLNVYGLALESKSGISLDNMSLRGASGINITAVDEGLTRGFCQARPYDLIILQYGLNVASPKQSDYSNYAKTLKAIISKLRSISPSSDLLIMSVSDRANKSAQGIETMQSIFYLHRTQQEVASQMGCAFWSTLKAMRSLGGIGKMAQRGEAAKDYTHLTHKGGVALAHQFTKALTIEKKYYDAVQ